MIREKLIESEIGTGGTKFRMRGREVSRVEALSAAAFGFAITLLVVSLEVPRTFDALAGYCYILIGPIMTVHGTIMGKKRKRLEASLMARETSAEAISD